MRYLASVVTTCFSSFGELLALNKRFAELSGGIVRYRAPPSTLYALHHHLSHGPCSSASCCCTLRIEGHPRKGWLNTAFLQEVNSCTLCLHSIRASWECPSHVQGIPARSYLQAATGSDGTDIQGGRDDRNH